MLQLYTAGNSICTQKVFITLAEKTLDWNETVVNLFKNEQYSAEYLKLNPKGVVPTLMHEGVPIIESTLICEYLDETFPEPALRPATPAGRARMRLWSKFIDEGIFEATREISFSAMFREALRKMSEEQRQTRFRNVGDPARRARYLSTYEEGEESMYVFQGIAAYEKMFKATESELASGATWLCGERFTLGDINLMPFVARMEYLNLLDVWTEKRPKTLEWWARAKARPSFLEAIIGRLKPEDIAAMKTHGSRIRDRIAERRAEYLAQVA